MTQFFTTSLWRMALSLSIVLLFAPRLFSQCNPDITPPVASCDEFTTVALGADGTATVMAATFDDGSFDDCCLGSFQVRRQADGPCDGDNTLDAFGPNITFCCAEIGAQFGVELQVNDCAGNSTICLVNVEVQDKTNPTLQAPADVTVLCSDFDPTLAAYGTPTITDNCCVDTFTIVDNYSQFDTLCLQGIITRTFRAFDCSGNSSTLGVVTAVQKITVQYDQFYHVKFPDDLVVTTEITPGTSLGEPSFFGEDCELIGVSYEDQIFPNPANNEMIIKRKWTVINWCTYDPGLPVVQVPNPDPNAIPDHPANFPGPTVSEPGTAAPWASTISKITPNDPSATDFSSFWIKNANGYQYTQTIFYRYFVGVEGTVFADSSANCAYEAGESKLAAWTVRATGAVSGQVVETLTDSLGHYVVMLPGSDTAVTITLVASSNFGLGCQSEYVVETEVTEIAVQDVPVHLEQRCALLSVGVATPRLRRCFDNRYTVQACNLSSETVPDAYVEVSLDDYFDYNASSVPGTLVSGNTYSFQIGDLEPGDCYTFTIDFLLNCNAPIGASHCTEAHIFPYDDCRENSNWSGADVEVTATCDVDSVRLAITNVGDANMTEILEFVVVEDVVMRQEGSFQLDINETLNFSFPANGSTWRLEAEEEPLHPWGGPQAVAMEGCGGINNAGLVNIFPLSNADPFEAFDCLENVGAYDPNDKQGIPEGYGAQHFIKANTDIEYLIRFQNTGTDTAFNVVILDKLADHLDASSVRVQVASHPMEFAMLEGNVMRFSFPNILLPDSNVNWAASNGFVKFRVSQKPDLAEGTVIENQAGIYFDFNDPVLTNTTFHTVGDHFVTVSTNDLESEGLLRSYPNPASDAVFFELKEQTNNGRFELTNNLGQKIASENFSGNQFRFDRKNLPAGIYQFQISANNTQIASGKIVLR